MVGVTTTWGTVLKGYCIRKVEKHCPTEIHECISFFPAPGPTSSHRVSAGLLRLDLSFTICSVAPVFLMEAVAIWNSLLCLFVLFVILLLFWGKKCRAVGSICPHSQQHLQDLQRHQTHAKTLNKHTRNKYWISQGAINVYSACEVEEALWWRRSRSLPHIPVLGCYMVVCSVSLAQKYWPLPRFS